MIIGFEAKRAFLNLTGLGNYSRFVIGALQEYYPEHYYSLFTPGIRRNAETEKLIDHSRSHLVTPKNLLRGSLWRSFGIAKEPAISRLSLFHGLSAEMPFFLPKTLKKIVTVHDLIFLRYPEFYKSVDKWIYLRKVKRACEQVDKIIAVSNQTASDVVNFLDVPRQKIAVVYQGCHEIFKQKLSEEQKQQVRLRYGIPDEYILSVGTIEKRKNALAIFQALATMQESDRLPVVLVGRKTPYLAELTSFLAQKGLSKYVTFIHDVAFSDLPAIYQSAKVFVYPSLFEGFGIPIVEAIESGVPIIASSGSCLEEAAGPDSIYVKPGDHEMVADRLRHVLLNPLQAAEMVKSGRAYAVRFSPENIARDLIHVYESVLRA